MAKYFIIQATPAKTEQRITEQDFLEEHWFVGHADWVSELRQEEAERLLSLFQGEGGIVYDAKEHTLQVISKETYFRSKWERFRQVLSDLEKAELRHFLSSKDPVRKANEEEFNDPTMDLMMHNLCKAYDDRYGNYISDENANLITLDEWVRLVPEKTPMYVGTVLKYHI